MTMQVDDISLYVSTMAVTAGIVLAVWPLPLYLSNIPALMKKPQLRRATFIGLNIGLQAIVLYILGSAMPPKIALVLGSTGLLVTLGTLRMTNFCRTCHGMSFGLHKKSCCGKQASRSAASQLIPAQQVA